ncbi:MAG: hypothetical protein KAW67_05225 [Candidatus Eisenbacteria sp.]|nr:hypothetical protein [Candidatus Eisenbacteria bacterium]
MSKEAGGSAATGVQYEHPEETPTRALLALAIVAVLAASAFGQGAYAFES